MKGLKIEFRVFSSRSSSLTQTFVKSCVDFEVIHTHGLEIAIQEHPTLNTNLNIPSEECSYTSELPSESVVYSIPEYHPLQSVVLEFLLFGFTAWALAVTPSMPCRLADLQLEDPVSL